MLTKWCPLQWGFSFFHNHVDEMTNSVDSGQQTFPAIHHPLLPTEIRKIGHIAKGHGYICAQPHKCLPFWHSL